MFSVALKKHWDYKFTETWSVYFERRGNFPGKEGLSKDKLSCCIMGNVGSSIFGTWLSPTVLWNRNNKSVPLFKPLYKTRVISVTTNNNRHFQQIEVYVSLVQQIRYSLQETKNRLSLQSQPEVPCLCDFVDFTLKCTDIYNSLCVSHLLWLICYWATANPLKWG